jgi:ATP-dependent DNA helicase RecQ
VSLAVPLPNTPRDPEPDLDAGLRRLGYERFRPGQREAIDTLLHEGRLLLVAPTGGGKSLTYQLPAAVLPGTALVVSPLVALMHDQVSALEERGVAATYLAATLPGHELRHRMARIASGEVSIVYAAPERLAFGGFQSMLRELQISLVAIDEAHCISEWGHDFRPEYLQIGDLLRGIGAPRVLACTATATPIVRDEILARLGLPPDTPQVIRGFARPNLALSVREISRPSDASRMVDAMLGEALGEPGHGRGTAIVYAPTRKRTEEEASRLAGRGWRAAAYHAGLEGRARDRVQAAFIAGSVEVVVATNAFGMGIDRADVRAVVHLAPPGSIEAYYQEVGRAGRDGEPAHGLMLVSARDLPLRRRLIESGTGDGTPPEPAVVEHKWAMFLELMRWAEGGSCRHDAILRYFGDEAEALEGCGLCDVCRSIGAHPEHEAGDVQIVVQKALSAVARIHRRFGLTAAVKLLRGVADPRLERSGLDRTRTHGALSDRTEAWITRLLRRCVTAGWIDYVGDEKRVVVLTDDGRAVMKGERPPRILLPGDDVEVQGVEAPAGRRRERAPRAEVETLDGPGQAMFEALRHWRLDRSRADGVPPYVVASDRTLREIAMLRPRTIGELQMAHGIGPAKLERYGEGLLAAVQRAQDS